MNPESLRFLIEKDGKLSKTAVLLHSSYVIVALKYLFAGTTVFGVTFPEFDANAALTLLGTVSALYFGANNVRVGGQNSN